MKVLVAVTEDWFALSHFAPILRELACMARDVVVVSRSSGRSSELRGLGVRTRHLDFHRGSLRPGALLSVRDGLARIIDEERPDVVHAIAMQTAIMSSLALSKTTHRPAAVILHITGLGYLATGKSPIATILRPIAYTVLKRCVSEHRAWVVTENDDDRATLIARGAAAPERAAIMPGAGIDLEMFPELPPPVNRVPRVAFVGRMLHSKGVKILVDAHRKLMARGHQIELALYGASDGSSRQAISSKELSRWASEPNVRWHGHIQDIVGVWRETDIAVVPSLGCEGMPRAMLEAAACGRPLIVSDVSGCRQFVRNGVEGAIVPPGDSNALAAALAKLASNTGLRLRSGAAARERTGDFSESRVAARTQQIYDAIMRPSRRAAHNDLPLIGIRDRTLPSPNGLAIVEPTRACAE